MKEYLEKLPEELKELIKTACRISRRENVRAYLVGGLVRDLLLGVENLDLDIVIEGDGIRFAEDFAAVFGAGVTAHRQFGTATVSVKPGLKVDFSSARKESYPGSAHLPVVKPG
ncbi:MAG: polynucleotide adenylyltransferase, partial [Candidatus Omnitrophota bacterium]